MHMEFAMAHSATGERVLNKIKTYNKVIKQNKIKYNTIVYNNRTHYTTLSTNNTTRIQLGWRRENTGCGEAMCRYDKKEH